MSFWADILLTSCCDCVACVDCVNCVSFPEEGGSGWLSLRLKGGGIKRNPGTCSCEFTSLLILQASERGISVGVPGMSLSSLMLWDSR